ncbi:MAG: DMT family transporter [Alphaproteobacteria bacterium]|nr:DMT family transporter [Alphaproteobacteria bacterium]
MNIGIYLTGLLTVACYGALSPIAKKLLSAIPSFAFVGMTALIVSSFAFASSIFYEKGFSLARLSTATWGGLLIFGIINFISYALYCYVIAKIPVTHYQLMELIAPIVGGILAYFLLREPFKPQYLAGLVIVGLGVFVAIRDWG